MIPDSGFGADVSGPAVRKIWDVLYGLQGAKAALPGGKLPPLPHINGAGQIVQSSTGKTGAKPAASRSAGSGG